MSAISSRPEDHGVSPWSVVGIRIEGLLKENPASEMYDVGHYHRDCIHKAREQFTEINEEDLRVMAFEVDWSGPVLCGVCRASLTIPATGD